MSILIKNVLFNDKTIDIYIEGKEIKQIGAGLSFPADKILDGSRKAVIPGFVNAHTHAAMTLFRGFGDDMPLMPWLEQKIWPNEAKMTREDVYWGAKLACLEMIKSGTTTFFDMYQRPRVTADVTEEMGLRGIIAGVCFDGFDKEEAEKCKRHNERLIQDVDNYSKRVRFSIGPHAISAAFSIISSSPGTFLFSINILPSQITVSTQLPLAAYTRFETKLKFGVKAGVLRSIKHRSAKYPSLICPAFKPNITAPSAVAACSISFAVKASGSFRQAFPNREASFIASIISKLLEEEQPSVPNPTVIPNWRISLNLKCMPEASFMFEAGLCTTFTS